MGKESGYESEAVRQGVSPQGSPAKEESMQEGTEGKGAPFFFFLLGGG